MAVARDSIDSIEETELGKQEAMAEKTRQSGFVIRRIMLNNGIPPWLSIPLG
jgi:hypothetical protein